MAAAESKSHTQRLFLLSNYVLIGAASSCIFLTLSLRLLPSLLGLLLILLHLLTIALSIFSSNCSSSTPRRHLAHMACTVLAAILQGAVALLVFSQTDTFLEKIRSYVNEENGVVILRMAGVLGLVMFVLEWVVLVLAFFMRFYGYNNNNNNNNGMGSRTSARVGQEEAVRKDWQPFQVV